MANKNESCWKCKTLLTNKSQCFLEVQLTLYRALCFGSLLGGSLSFGISVSSGTKMNHWRGGRVPGKDPERAGSRTHAIANLECPAWWAGV